MLPEFEIHTTADETRYALYTQEEIISNEIRNTGFWNSSALQICGKILEKANVGSRVIDIGAGIGSFTVPLARQFSDKFIFAAFEPMSTLFVQLCTNIFINHIETSKPYNIGLGDENKLVDAPILDIHTTNNHGSYSFIKEINALRGMVQSDQNEVYDFRTLDSFRFSNVCLIKISTPGMELEVLKGAQQTIVQNNYPPVVFETWDAEWYTEKKEKVIDFFKSNGYEHYCNLGAHMIAFKKASYYNYVMLPANEVESITNFKVVEQQHDTKSVLESQKPLTQ
jgi:hypothetical protein